MAYAVLTPGSLFLQLDVAEKLNQKIHTFTYEKNQIFFFSAPITFSLHSASAYAWHFIHYYFFY